MVAETSTSVGNREQLEFLMSARGEKPAQPRCEIGFIAKRTLPQHHDCPTLLFEIKHRSLVPRDIAANLGTPIGGVSLWLTRSALAVMAVPKTPMDKNDAAFVDEDKIRRTR